MILETLDDSTAGRGWRWYGSGSGLGIDIDEDTNSGFYLPRGRSSL